MQVLKKSSAFVSLFYFIQFEISGTEFLEQIPSETNSSRNEIFV